MSVGMVESYATNDSTYTRRLEYFITFHSPNLSYKTNIFVNEATIFMQEDEGQQCHYRLTLSNLFREHLNYSENAIQNYCDSSEAVGYGADGFIE